MESLISVIVPVYNISEFIPQCLRSLIEQTHQNLEIIVVDDGSTDNSGCICDNIAAQSDNKIKVIHTSNKGLSAARNIGLQNAHGEYIGFIDGDDWAEPTMFEQLLKNIQASKADLSVCGVKYDYNNGEDPIQQEKKHNTCDQKELFQQIMRNKNICGYVCNKLFIRKILAGMTFNEMLYSCEDLDFTVRYASKCNKFTYTTDKLYHYRQRLGSMTGEFSYSYRKLSILTAYENILPIYQSYCPELVYLLHRNYLKINLNIIGRMHISKYKDPNIVAQLNKNINKVWPQVIFNKKNSIITRANILLTHWFPGLMLRCKQLIQLKRYR